MLEPTRLTALRRASRAAGCARARTRHLRHMYINHSGTESRPLPADSNVIGLPPPPVFRPSSYSGTEQEPVQFDVRQGEPSSRVSASPTASEPLESIPDPFANVSADPEPDPSEMAVARVTLRAPWNTAVNRRQHPFDSHKFVSALEKASLDSNTSKALMEGVRGLMVSRKEQAMGKMLVREEADNEAYVFKAALSKLRTEANVRNRNTGLAARSALSAVRRELERLEHKIAGDMQVLKHDVEMDMSESKDENRTTMKMLDIQIEEINGRATISIGDLRTEIESAKWDSTRRAITIIVVLVICGVGISTLTLGVDDTQTAVPPPPPKVEEPATRDIGIGPDEDPFDYETRIDKILSAVPPPPERERKPRRNSMPSMAEFPERI